MPETATNSLKAFHVPFDSMEPAISPGSNVVADLSYYSQNAPKRWDVVMFQAPGVTGSDKGSFVKRIIGLPGETIHLSHRGLRINGAMMSVPSPLTHRFSSFRKHEEHKFGHEPFKIPADSVFVIGDNLQAYVSDSRELGPIPVRNLEARVLASIDITPII